VRVCDQTERVVVKLARRVPGSPRVKQAQGALAMAVYTHCYAILNIMPKVLEGGWWWSERGVAERWLEPGYVQQRVGESSWLGGIGPASFRASPFPAWQTFHLGKHGSGVEI
jgi:hypothetical protein